MTEGHFFPSLHSNWEIKLLSLPPHEKPNCSSFAKGFTCSFLSSHLVTLSLHLSLHFTESLHHQFLLRLLPKERCAIRKPGNSTMLRALPLSSWMVVEANPSKPDWTQLWGKFFKDVCWKTHLSSLILQSWNKTLVFPLNYVCANLNSLFPFFFFLTSTADLGKDKKKPLFVWGLQLCLPSRFSPNIYFCACLRHILTHLHCRKHGDLVRMLG